MANYQQNRVSTNALARRILMMKAKKLKNWLILQKTKKY